jgi:hypothetical protein
VMLHNVSYVLKHPEHIQLLAERTNNPRPPPDERWDISHLCHNPSCFNPWHLHLEHGNINEDRKGCRYGCPHGCPHQPTCLF